MDVSTAHGKSGGNFPTTADFLIIYIPPTADINKTTKESNWASTEIQGVESAEDGTRPRVRGRLVVGTYIGSKYQGNRCMHACMHMRRIV